jgi:hypothetical protein
MADPSSRRKLAAILSADVVGYSRLMAANEAATVETLKSYRDIIARLVVRRGGRVVNAPGDALLAEFPSAVEAVQAAIRMRQGRFGPSPLIHVWCHWPGGRPIPAGPARLHAPCGNFRSWHEADSRYAELLSPSDPKRKYETSAPKQRVLAALLRP